MNMAQAKISSAPTVTVTAVDPVSYDGALHAPGESFDIAQGDLAQLQAVGAVAVNPAPAA
jgi:hypothetical protein